MLTYITTPTKLLTELQDLPLQSQQSFPNLSHPNFSITKDMYLFLSAYIKDATLP